MLIRKGHGLDLRMEFQVRMPNGNCVNASEVPEGYEVVECRLSNSFSFCCCARRIQTF